VVLSADDAVFFVSVQFLALLSALLLLALNVEGLEGLGD
jgi:hypothetical protein